MSANQTIEAPESVERTAPAAIRSTVGLAGQIPKPYYQENGITIYCCDNRKIVPLLGEYDLLLTDPPYGLNVLKTGKVGYTGAKEWGKSDWDASTPDRWMMELVRAKSRWQIIWGGNYYELPPTKAWLIWNKMQRDFSFADGELAWSNLDAAVRIMDYSRGELLAEGKQHPTQKPLPLISWCLNQVPDAKTILDPWMGSGTTLVAAKERGLQAVGIEANETYCKVAVARLAQGVLWPANAEVSDRRAHGNENTTGANGGSLH